MSADSVAYTTVAALSGVTCSGTQPFSPRPSRVSRSRAPSLMQTAEFCVSAGRRLMATGADRHPFGITGVGYTGGPVGLGVTRSGEAGVVGLGSEEVTDADEVQDAAAADSSTQTTASRAPVPPSGPMGAISPSVAVQRLSPVGDQAIVPSGTSRLGLRAFSMASRLTQRDAEIGAGTFGAAGSCCGPATWTAAAASTATCWAWPSTGSSVPS